jgi:hypothetical protein
MQRLTQDTAFVTIIFLFAGMRTPTLHAHAPGGGQAPPATGTAWGQRSAVRSRYAKGGPS